MRYGIKEVFDLKFYNNATNLQEFYIFTSKSVSIEKTPNGKFLKIRDALLNLEVFNDVMNDKYDYVEFKIFGYSMFRNLEQVDEKMQLIIPSAKLHSYRFPTDTEDVSVVELVFKIEGSCNIKKV